MSIVFGFLDPVMERRVKTLSAVKIRLAQMVGAGSQLKQWEVGSLSILAATNSVSRVDHNSGRGIWSWVFGDIHSNNGASPANAVIDKVATEGALAVNGLNGYYLGCVVDHADVVTVGTDVLGSFPLYYWGDSEAFAFSTVPALLHAHPRCPARLSLEGLAGVMLQGHMVNGQTLWEKILRPDPGYAVRWTAGRGVESIQAYPLLPTENHFGIRYEAARNLVSETLGDAVQRAAGNKPVGLMLSGGMDSRLVAGYLQRKRPESVTAFTFGDRNDVELRCALGVAKRLRMPIVKIPIRYGEYAMLAAKQVAQESLSNTFLDFGWLSGANTLHAYESPLLNGFSGNTVMGETLNYPYDPQKGVYSFEKYFNYRTKPWGFSPEEICQIVTAPSMKSVVSDVFEKYRENYNALPGHPFRKGWLRDLYTRCRYHVSPYAWRLGVSTWPCMPYIDREVLEVAAGMPLDYLNGRRMQVDIMKREFTSLAKLPLDRNSIDSTPLLPSRRYLFGRQALARFPRLLVRRKKSLVYFRTFDINNPGWKAVRTLAEQHRHITHQLIKPDALQSWIPHPKDAISFKHGISDTSRHKILIGLMIISGQNLGGDDASIDH